MQPLPEDGRAATEHLEAAVATFAVFRDHAGSWYYAAPGLTPEETWQRVARELGRVTVLVALDADDGRQIAAPDISAIHDGIFRPVFESKTLRMRRNEEPVEFPLLAGPREAPERRSMSGASARSLDRLLRKITSDLNQAISAREQALARGEKRTVMASTRPAAQAFGRLLAAHPWMDGNLRSAYPVLVHALIRLGLPYVAAFEDTDDFNWCLGQAMIRRRRNVEPLAEYLASKIRASDQ